MEKTFKFASCDNANPGELVINGTDSNSNNWCSNGGLILMCTARNSTSPWHEFKSDTENWVNNEDNSTPCTNEDGFIPAAMNQNIGFIVDMFNNGASKIWADSKMVSLKGSPE